jgi:glutamate-5-semialdehyde dehydrogenase
MKKIQLQKIQAAALELGKTSEKERNAFLRILKMDIVANKKKILAANLKDIQRAKKKKLEQAFIQRLVLDEGGIIHLGEMLGKLTHLESGLGETIEKKENLSGFSLRKVRVPLGVIFVIYEARPEVTIDVAALCIKSGNAALLKGGSEALHTNKVLYTSVQKALKKSGLAKETVSFIDTDNRKVTNELLTRHDVIDLVIARGGYAMVKAVTEKSSIPVLAHSAGGARIYVDKSANLDMAEKILINAKITKPAACNSLDAILVHRSIAKVFVASIVTAMEGKGVTVLGDKQSRKFAKIALASKTDLDREFLSRTVLIKVVKDAQEAVEFTNKHGKKHSEGVIAENKKVVDYFLKSVDAAALFVNCSPRLHDGYVFGLGSEMGISTAKLHARGPVGLKELTTYKWHVYGKGHIR